MSNTLFNLFINAHILTIAGTVFSYVIRILSLKKLLNISAAHELRFNHILIVAVFVLPAISTFSARQFDFSPIAKTITSVTYKDFDSKTINTDQEKVILGHNVGLRSFDLGFLKTILFILLLSSIIFSFVQVFRESRLLNSILKSCQIVRKYEKIRIAFSDKTTVPFSLRTINCYWIILPAAFSLSCSKTRISILHENQHHRQGDTLWLYVLLIMKAILGANPLILLWLKIISEVQELKVDEVLIDQKMIKPQDYARCLIEVAESVVRGEEQLVCATGLAFLPDRQQLKRRIEQMFTKRVTNKVNMLVMSVCLMFSMTALALTTSRVVGSSRVTMVEAQKMAAIAQRDSEFPIVVNDLVLEQLNRYIGTAQGREFMRNSLARMKAYQATIEKKLQEYNLPNELLAVPLIESGYQNLLPSQNPNGAAGLWQFIQTTAWGYGLQVWDSVDERLDVEKSTDAAMRLLLANKVRFKNWELSALAYNSGEKIVSKGILKTKSYDAWTLIRNGYENDKGYLAKLMAAMLIMKNPESVE